MSKKDDFQKSLKELEDNFSGNIGVSVRVLDDGEDGNFTYNEEVSFPTASVIKVPILVEALKQVQDGRKYLQKEYELKEKEKVGGSGILKEMSSGTKLNLLDLLTLMIVISDNTATNKVIDIVGVDSVNESMSKLGLQNIYLSGKLMQNEKEKKDKEEKSTSGEYSKATPEDLLQLLVMLYKGEILNTDETKRAIDIMENQHFVTNMIGRYLPYDPEDTPEKSVLRIASKSGAIRGVRNDIGFIWYKDLTYAVAMMTKNCEDTRFYPDNEGALTVAKVSKKVYDIVSG